MRTIFVDTGAFYALADKHDPAFARADRFYREAEVPFLTSDYIFAETMSLLTKRLGKRVSVEFGRALRTTARIRIEEPSAEVRGSAWKIFTQRTDKDYDLIDCISFAMMDSFHIREVFGFDRHFAQYGFTLLP